MLGPDRAVLLQVRMKVGSVGSGDPNPQAPGSAAPGATGRLAARPIAVWGLTDRARSEDAYWHEPDGGLETRTFGALLRNLALVRVLRNYALLRWLSGRS